MAFGSIKQKPQKHAYKLASNRAQVCVFAVDLIKYYN